MAAYRNEAGAQSAEGFAKRVKRARMQFGVITFIVIVFIPTILAACFFMVQASHQYASEFNFAVRGRKDGTGMDQIGAILGGGASMASSSDSYIVVDYLESLELVRELDKRVNLRSVFSGEDADWLHRFEPSGSIEDLRDYWEWKIDATYDLSRGIVSVTVWTFSPEDSIRVAGEVLNLTRGLVDQISREARQEALVYADEQVNQAAGQLRAARLAVQDFRNRESVIDPTADAQRIYEQISLLETAIIELNTQLETKVATTGRTSAGAQQLRQQLQATERQLELVKDSIDDRLPSLAREFESLQTDQEIARETYAAALSARHEAAAIATQRQVYVSVYDPPMQAEASLYPERGYVIFLFFIAAGCVWGLFYVVTLNMRDAAM